MNCLFFYYLLCYVIMQDNDEEILEYVGSLRIAVLEAWTGIFQGFTDEKVKNKHCEHAIWRFLLRFLLLPSVFKDYRKTTLLYFLVFQLPSLSGGLNPFAIICKHGARSRFLSLMKKKSSVWRWLKKLRLSLGK